MGRSCKVKMGMLLAGWPGLVLLAAGALYGRDAADDRLERALGATFRLTDGRVAGTGFFVEGSEPPPRPAEAKPDGPRKLLLVTAAHTLEQMTGATLTLVGRQADPEGGYLRRDTTLPIRMGSDPLWKRHKDLDLAVLAVDVPDELAITPFRRDELATETWLTERRMRVGETVYLPGFPAQLEANPAGWPVLRKGMAASHPLVPHKGARTWMVDCSSFGGDSGAPLVQLTEDGLRVVGVMLGMHRQTDRMTGPQAELTTHTPLGIGIAVHGFCIGETLSRLEAGAGAE